MSTTIVAGSREAWARRVLGLSAVRRHVLAAERAGEGPVTVVGNPEDVDALRAELHDTRALIGTTAPPGAVRSCADEFDLGAILRALHKPTDNKLARLNRRVSIPISRVLCRTPLSPNAISIIGLFISIGAGLAYARGGYLWMLLGAFLGWFSSMWDGCDGEVARMTYRESDFGCWLEGVCDDLYYASAFLGIGVGLWRTGAGRLAITLCVIALVGIIILFPMHYVLRAKVAARTGAGAASFAKFFEERMNALGDDPLVKFSRLTWKLGTRSTLPYILLVLALFGQNWFALVIAAAGAHIYWILTIYVWRVEPSRPPVPSLQRSTVPRHD